MEKRKLLNLKNFDALRDNNHILLFRTQGRRPIMMGKIEKRKLTETTSDNSVILILHHPDGSSFGLTLHSIRNSLYEYEKGRIFVLNDSLFF